MMDIQKAFEESDFSSYTSYEGGAKAMEAETSQKILELTYINAELQSKTEACKCCGCCKYVDQDYDNSLICAFSPPQIENPKLSDSCNDFEPRGE